VARSKKKRKINLKKERVKSHKVILNISIVVNRGIIPGIVTQNRNKMEELK
jgi:hypothetical protein